MLPLKTIVAIVIPSLLFVSHLTLCSSVEAHAGVKLDKAANLLDPTFSREADLQLLENVRQSQNNERQMYGVIRAAIAHHKNAAVLIELLELSNKDKKNAVVRAAYCYLFSQTYNEAGKLLQSHYSEYEGASRTFLKEATDFAPKSWLTLIATARVAETRSTRALQLCQQAAQLYPNLPEVHYELGYWYYARAISVTLDNSQSENNRAKASRALFANSIAQLSQSAVMNPAFASPWYGLAHLYNYGKYVKDPKKAASYVAEYRRRIPATYTFDPETEKLLNDMAQGKR